MAIINKYVITFDENTNLLDPYTVIEGKTPKEALKNTFNKDYQRLYGDNGRYASIILVKGDFINNDIVYKGKYQRLCFGEIQ